MEVDPVGGWKLQLSPVDARMLRFVLQTVFVFPPPPSNAAPYDLEKLRQSFNQLLQEDFPFFKDSERARNEESGELWLRSRQKGGQDKQVIEIQELPALTRMDEVLESTPVHFIPARPDSQVLSVKCCLLIDRALVIGVDADHCIVDAEGLALFMKRWSCHHNGVTTADAISVRLSHDRHQLIAPSSDSSTMPHPEYACVCHASTQSPHPMPSRLSRLPTTQQRFHLSPTELRNLKAFASLDDETSTVSTLDCVTALLTWLITISRGHGDVVQVSTAVNLRRRVQPPLPDHFTGNAVLPALSCHPAQDFQASSSGPSGSSVHAIARRVRESIAKFDDAFIRDTVSLLAAHPDPDTLQPALRLPGGPDLLFSSWRGLGLSDVSFGSSPAYVGPPTLANPIDGVVVFLEPVDSRPGLDALVFLDHQAMHKLLELWQQRFFFFIKSDGVSTNPQCRIRQKSVLQKLQLEFPPIDSLQK